MSGFALRDRSLQQRQWWRRGTFEGVPRGGGGGEVENGKPFADREVVNVSASVKKKYLKISNSYWFYLFFDLCQSL